MFQDPIVTLGIVREKLVEARKTISEQQELIEVQKKQIEALKDEAHYWMKLSWNVGE